MSAWSTRDTTCMPERLLLAHFYWCLAPLDPRLPKSHLLQSPMYHVEVSAFSLTHTSTLSSQIPDPLWIPVSHRSLSGNLFFLLHLEPASKLPSKHMPCSGNQEKTPCAWDHFSHMVQSSFFPLTPQFFFLVVGLYGALENNCFKNGDCSFIFCILALT